MFSSKKNVEAETERDPAEEEVKRTCELLRKTLCMMAPLDEILDDDVQDYPYGKHPRDQKQGKQFLLEAVSQKEEREKEMERERDKGKQKGKTSEPSDNKKDGEGKGKEKTRDGSESARFNDDIGENYHKAPWASMNVLQMLESVKGKIKPDGNYTPPRPAPKFT